MPVTARRIERALLRQGRLLVSWLPVFWTAGILVYFAPRYEPGPIFACVLAIIAAALVWRGWSRILSRSLGLGLLMLALGFLDARLQAHRQAPMPALPTLATMVSGTLVEVSQGPADARGDTVQRLRLRKAVFETGVDIGMAPLQRDLLLFLRDSHVYIPGERLRMRAVLRQPDWPDYPGARDRQREAWFGTLAGTGHVLGTPQRLSLPQGARLARVRKTIASVVFQHLDGQRAAIAATLLAGHGESISRATREAFAASGLAHILAVAGLHLGLIMGAVFVSVRQILVLWPRVGVRLPCKGIAACLALLVGCLYVALTGCHLPAVRSLCMASLATMALLAGRQVLSMRSLSVVALVLLVVSPVLALDLSFQMSFAAVMALIAGYDRLRPFLARRSEQRQNRGGGGHYLLMAGLTSALAGGATLPVVMAGFGTLQPWFILANLIAVPVAAVCIMPAGLAALCLMPFGLSGGPLWIMGQGIGAVCFLAGHVASWPYARIAIPHTPWWGLVLYMTGLSGICLWRGPVRLVFMIPVTIALLSPFIVPVPVVLVSPDAGLIGFVEAKTIFVGPHGTRENGTLEAWRRALSMPVQQSLASSSCEPTMCLLDLHGLAMQVWFALPPADERDAACVTSDILVSTQPLPDHCRPRHVIDRFTVWRDGAVALYARSGRVAVVSDRSWRGNRLWVPRTGFRGLPNLPLARAE